MEGEALSLLISRLLSLPLLLVSISYLSLYRSRTPSLSVSPTT